MMNALSIIKVQVHTSVNAWIIRALFFISLTLIMAFLAELSLMYQSKASQRQISIKFKVILTSYFLLFMNS